MASSRREFLKTVGLSGLGMAGASITGWKSQPGSKEGSGILKQLQQSHNQLFNMSGYAAPGMDTIGIGFIGLGNRGPTHLRNATLFEGVEIKGLCDIRPEKVAEAKEMLKETPHNPDIYTGSVNAWQKMCDRDDIDLVFIATPWDWHTPMAVYAMEQGKHAAIEVPAATTLEECWQLVETSERTRKHCMMLENCCYGFFELLTLNMARQGFFGEIVHGEGAYIHDLLGLNFSKEGYWKMWRLRENIGRNGNLYPTHGLGPVCQIMDINRGDQMDYLTSMSSDDFLMAKTANELAAKDNFFAPYARKEYRGNMNTTTIRTKKGRTIMVQHDVTSPRVYSRIHLISGTKGTARKYPSPKRIATSHRGWLPEEEFKAMQKKYEPEIVKKMGKMAKKVGGHGGMDFLLDWRLIDCVRNGLPLDMDVYDAALWSSISPLSEWSVSNRSDSVDVPDFTAGAWRVNKPVDMLLQSGDAANTKVNAA